MINGLEASRIANLRKRTPNAHVGGFSLIELLVGMSIMAVALLSIATMFSTGYTGVSHGGRTTMATAAARQMIEDMQALGLSNFDRLGNLNGFDTNNVATLPANNPEQDLARKWLYALAGEAPGWPAYSAAEKAMWSILTVSDGANIVPLGARGQINTALVPGSTSLMTVTVTVTAPGRPAAQIATLISRL